jgi:hypothetical protein
MTSQELKKTLWEAADNMAVHTNDIVRQRRQITKNLAEEFFRVSRSFEVSV